MPWVSTRELPNPRRGKVNYAARRDYERTWRVEMSLPTDGSIQVSVAPGIPFMFSPYVDADGTYDFGAILYELSAEQEPDMLWWRVTGKYISGERSRYSRFSPEKGDNRFNDQNPLNRPPQFIWGTAKYQRPLLYDYTGVPTINLAGDAFDPPFMVEDDRLTLTLIQNEAFYDNSVTIAYQGSINSDSFLGAPPLTTKLNERSARSNVENNFLYWEVTYQFEFRRFFVDDTLPHSDATTDAQTWLNPGYVQYSRELGWLRVQRNEGFYQVAQVNGQLQYQRIQDGKGKDKVTPTNLGFRDQNGQVFPLAPGTPPIYLVFHVYPEMKFGDLLTVG